MIKQVWENDANWEKLWTRWWPRVDVESLEEWGWWISANIDDGVAMKTWKHFDGLAMKIMELDLESGKMMIIWKYIDDG